MAQMLSTDPRLPQPLQPGIGPMEIPGMLAPEECAYLDRVAREVRGRGRVVELGCFLGRSTVSLLDGLRANPRAILPMLTYDSFRLDGFAASYFDLSLQAGDDFQPLFRQFVGDDRLGNILVRSEWVPETLTDERERALYPEQSPIELLFVDLAKSWRLHKAVLQVFGRHMVDEAVLIEQDFRDSQAYWIPVNHHHLRDVFASEHWTTTSCTVSFRVMRGLTVGDIEMLSDPMAMSIDEAARMWDEIEAWWKERVGLRVLPRLRMARAFHMLDLHAREQVIDAMEGALDIVPMVSIEDGYTVEVTGLSWWLGYLERKLLPLPGGSAFAPIIAGWWQRIASMETERWNRIAEELLADGRTRIALYGAGQHTRRLLASGWASRGVEVRAIVDDCVRDDLASIEGIPIVLPKNAPRDLDAIVLSSDAHEAALARRAEEEFGGRGIPIVRMYTSSEPVPITHPIHPV